MCSVLARVPDFHPYFYIPAPDQPGSTHPDALQELQHVLNRYARPNFRVCCICRSDHINESKPIRSYSWPCRYDYSKAALSPGMHALNQYVAFVVGHKDAWRGLDSAQHICIIKLLRCLSALFDGIMFKKVMPTNRGIATDTVVALFWGCSRPVQIFIDQALYAPHTTCRGLAADTRIVGIEAVSAQPIMYYRAESPGAAQFLRLTLARGGGSSAVKRAGGLLSRVMAGSSTEGTALQVAGFRWRDTTRYEDEVALLQRFLTDACVSGGEIWPR